MDGPAPVTLSPIPTTAGWDASRFTMSYIGSANTPGVDASTGLRTADVRSSGTGDLTDDG